MQTPPPVVSGMQIFRPEDPVQLAIEGMNRLHVSYVLITQNQTLVGILTERDILRAAAASIDLRSTPLAQLMSQPVICCTESESQDRARVTEILHRYQIRHLPVITPQGQVCGVITPDEGLPNK